MNTFSKREAISFGWQTFWAHWQFLLGLLLLAFLLPLIPSFLANLLSEKYPLFSLILGLLTLPFQFLIALGTVKIYLQLTDKQPTGYGELFKHLRLVIPFFLAQILAGVIIFLGFLLLIIPGLIFSIKLQFWSYALVDQSLGPIAALKTSWNMTKGHKWNIFLFNLLLIAISFLGILTLGLGFLVIIPLSQLATAFVYRKLSST